MARRPILVLLAVGVLVLLPAAGSGLDTPPWAVNWGPKGPNVSVDTRIQVFWSERMNWTSVEQAFSYSDGSRAYTAGTWVHDGVTNTSVFTPASLLAPGTLFTVRIESTAADPTGDRLDQNRNLIGGETCDVGPPSTWDCLVWQFMTLPPPLDTTPPRVISTMPLRDGVAATNAGIEVRFSEAMGTASVEAAFSYGDGYSLYTTADGTASWFRTSAPDDTLRFSPRLEFAFGGIVAVNLRGAVARDVAGNLLDGDGNGTGGDDYAWSFSVSRDPIPPKVLTTFPLEGAASVSISTSITVVFSKAMTRTAAEGSLSLGGPGAPTLTGANGSLSWSGSRFPDDTLVFNPYPNLRTSTPYRFVLTADLAADREGLHLDGNRNGTSEGSPADDFTMNFTTEVEDRTPPNVVARTPAAGAMGVIPSTKIAIAFSEPMNRTSAEAAFSYTDGIATFGIRDGAGTWNLGADDLAFQPSWSLDFGTRYTVRVDGAVARDDAGNLLNAGASETWNFTTAGQPDKTPPWIRWTSPFTAQRNVSRTARISIIFSEAMDRPRVQAAMGITGGAALTDFRWPNDATVEAGTSAPMAYKTPYAVFVLTGATDLAGNPLLQPAEIRFTTEPWRGPVVGRVVDGEGSGIDGALVELNGLAVLSNATGGFFFEAVEQGTYTLKVSRSGYEPFTKSVQIEPGAGILGTIALRRLSGTVDATIWAAVGAVLLFVLLLAVLLRRRRSGPTEHYETWRPAKVVVVEPGRPRDRP